MLLNAISIEDHDPFEVFLSLNHLLPNLTNNFNEHMCALDRYISNVENELEYAAARKHASFRKIDH